MSTTQLSPEAELRLSLLKSAPLGQWIALSSDESRIVAQGESFGDVVDAAERAGETDPLVIHVPEDWDQRTLSAA